MSFFDTPNMTYYDDKWYTVKKQIDNTKDGLHLHNPRRLHYEGPPMWGLWSQIYYCQITEVNNSTGVYTCRIQTTEQQTGDDALFKNGSGTVTAYDYAQLAGLTDAATNRFNVGDHVKVGMTEAELYCIIDPISPSFQITKVDDTKVSITGGTIRHLANNVIVTVDPIVSGTVSNNDYIWIQRDGANEWHMNNGAALPVDKLYLELAQITFNTHGKISLIETYWPGGDIVWPEEFPVVLVSDGGDPGTVGSECTFTYTVTTPGGIEIMTGAAPSFSAARLEMTGCVSATDGVARIKPDGNFELVEAFETWQYPPGLQQCDLENDGGSAGDNTTPCTYTYTVKLLGSGTTVATGLAPNNSRARILNAPTTAGTHGAFYYDEDGDPVLSLVDETLAQYTCT